MSRFTRPLLPVALPVLALLLVAAGPAGVGSQSGNEAGKVSPAGPVPDVKSTPTPSPPTPQSAPDRPHTQPKAEASPPTDRSKGGGETPPEAKPETGAPPETKPETGAPPEKKPETGAPPEEKPETGAPPEEKPETGAPPEEKPEAGAPPKNLKPIAPEEAVNILGKKVYGPADEDMGMVIDVLVDSDGRPRAAIIDFGGFLGVGSRKIAIDWELLQFRPADRTHQVRLGLGRTEVQAAPEYKPSGQPAEVVAPAPPPPEVVAPDAEK